MYIYLATKNTNFNIEAGLFFRKIVQILANPSTNLYTNNKQHTEWINPKI